MQFPVQIKCVLKDFLKSIALQKIVPIAVCLIAPFDKGMYFVSDYVRIPIFVNQSSISLNCLASKVYSIYTFYPWILKKMTAPPSR